MSYVLYKRWASSPQDRIQVQDPQQVRDARRSAQEMMRRNEIGEGFKHLRELAEDQSYPRIERGITVAYMADIMMTKTTRSPTYAEHVFVGYPYDSFWDVSITDEDARMGLGIRRIYEYSLVFGDLPASYFRLVQWEINRAREGGDERDAHIKQAEEYLKKGDEAFTKALASGRPTSPQLIGYTQFLKGMVSGDLADLKDNPELAVQAERLFQDAITTLSKLGGFTEDKDVHLLWTRLYYAMFLEERFGDAKKEVIDSLLAEIAHPRYRDSTRKFELGFFRYVRRLGSIEPTFFDLKREKERILALAKLNSDFAKMLKELGWGI
ncbi:MAG: hypothetical protein Q8R40_01725 [bacterium]|nr:hypothetical protein [bacterium]